MEKDELGIKALLIDDHEVKTDLIEGDLEEEVQSELRLSIDQWTFS